MAKGKRGTGRAYRRHRKNCAIERVFRRMFFHWDRRSDWPKRNYLGYELCVGIDAWACQDEHKASIFVESKRLADNVCSCRCHYCNGYKRVDRRLCRRRTRIVTVVDADDFRFAD